MIKAGKVSLDIGMVKQEIWQRYSNMPKVLIAPFYRAAGRCFWKHGHEFVHEQEAIPKTWGACTDLSIYIYITHLNTKNTKYFVNREKKKGK